jgi:hypothetical protein
MIALDPGTTHTAFVQFERGLIIDHGHLPNAEIRQILIGREYNSVACEMIASYGMAVGKEVFQTCVWIGRFIEVARVDVELIFRKDIKLFLCGTMRAKDANVRQALLDLVGPQGRKAEPGPTYGIKSHTWAALAVAVYAAQQKKKIKYEIQNRKKHTNT